MEYSYLNKTALGIPTNSDFVEIMEEFINSLI